jgi:hypothetical protein
VRFAYLLKTLRNAPDSLLRTTGWMAGHCAHAGVAIVRGGRWEKLVVEEEKLLCAIEKS